VQHERVNEDESFCVVSFLGLEEESVQNDDECCEEHSEVDPTSVVGKYSSS